MASFDDGELEKLPSSVQLYVRTEATLRKRTQEVILQAAELGVPSETILECPVMPFTSYDTDRPVGSTEIELFDQAVDVHVDSITRYDRTNSLRGDPDGQIVDVVMHITADGEPLVLASDRAYLEGDDEQPYFSGWYQMYLSPEGEAALISFDMSEDLEGRDGIELSPYELMQKMKSMNLDTNTPSSADCAALATLIERIPPCVDEANVRDIYGHIAD